jgi:acyl-CoA synthetase (AMP-forming)/AMP-acid ligase II/thioesterase domain-containing protein/acyl carrier protein
MTDSIHARFQWLAQSAGEVEAILAPGREPLTFAELWRQLVAIRDQLAELGISRGARVASALPRGPETALCSLGVASCAVYAPLNPDYTEAEFAAYLGRLRPQAIIVPQALGSAARASAQALGIAVLELCPEEAGAAGSFSLRAPQARLPSVTPHWSSSEDLALVLLTSGTTSRQKLVPMRQRHLLAYADSVGQHRGLGRDDRCLHVMPMFHGHGIKSALLVPLANCCGVICSRQFDIPSFFEQMRTLKPTWYSAASSIHQMILSRVHDYGDVARRAGLRFIRSGSGRLDSKVGAGLERAFGAPMIESYGMSETSTLTSNPLPPGERRPGTVGRSIGNEVAIMDAEGNLLRPGREGEVVARGPTVFDGYLDDPQANAAAFANGWFRTGDLGRFDDEGYLTLLGRLKDVINRGGEKVGTLEVEAALTRHPAVEQACVFAIPHPSLGEEVAAAVVLSPGQHANEQSIQAHARGMLTGFKVPRCVFFVPAFPKSATNKVERRQVAQMCLTLLARCDSPEPDASPWSPLERDIARLWQRVLGIDAGRIVRGDDFFLLGGDSLKAYELFAHIRKRYRVSVGLRHLFDEAATVAGMARLIEARRSAPALAERESARLVVMKDDGERPPLFAVPGSGGNPVGFIHLARLLDKRQPLVGIEARGMDGSAAPLCRIEDIAADHLALVRRMQPAGPYFLSGACFGARVAYEMARQLQAAGDHVGLLLMLDPSSPFHNADGRPRGTGTRRPAGKVEASVMRFVLARAALYARTLAKANWAQRRAFLAEKLATLGAMIRERDLFRGDPSELHARAVYQANRAAGSAYVPGPFDGPVLLCFTAGRPVRGTRNYRLDWSGLVPQAGAPVYVPGKDSGDMLNLPHVYELAALVNRCLEQVHAAQRPARAGARRAVHDVDSVPAWI